MARELGIGVRGAAHVVRPVVHGGDAGAERLGEAEPHAAIAVLRRVVRAEARGDGEISVARIVGAYDRPQHAGPQVPVRVDEAGHADHAAPVDDLGARRSDSASHRDDGAVAHMHVAARKLADRRIHGEHVGATHDELAARRQGRSRLRALPGGADLCRGSARQQAGRSQGCGCCKDSAPIDLISSRHHQPPDVVSRPPLLAGPAAERRPLSRRPPPNCRLPYLGRVAYAAEWRSAENFLVGRCPLRVGPTIGEIN